MAKNAKGTGKGPGKGTGYTDGSLGRSLDAPIHQSTGAYGKEMDGVLGRMVGHFDNALNKNRARK